VTGGNAQQAGSVNGAVDMKIICDQKGAVTVRKVFVEDLLGKSEIFECGRRRFLQQDVLYGHTPRRQVSRHGLGFRDDRPVSKASADNYISIFILFPV